MSLYKPYEAEPSDFIMEKTLKKILPDIIALQ